MKTPLLEATFRLGIASEEIYLLRLDGFTESPWIL
jgi:hypothetical protein